MVCKPDSLIFDMDGTMWDAVDSYCKIWDVTSDAFGIRRRIGRDELLATMGLTIDQIFDRLFPDSSFDRAEYLKLLADNERKMMPELGGKLYPGVAENVPLLAKQYKLLMVSNCGADGLKNFLAFTGLGEYFTDTLTFGETGCDKPENIRLIVQRNGLKNPLYVGDTAGDCRSAHAAGGKMLHVTYGFGTCDDAEYTANSFDELTKMLLNNGNE